MDRKNLSVLDGTLVYDWRTGQWKWLDGRAEPRVHTLSRQYFAPNFRCTTLGNQGTFAEIPHNWEHQYGWNHSDDICQTIQSLIREHGWKSPVYAEGLAEKIDDHRTTVDGHLVPIEVWDDVMREPYGAGWDSENEADILALADRMREQDAPDGDPGPV